MHKKMVGLTGVGLIASGAFVVARYLRRRQQAYAETRTTEAIVPNMASKVLSQTVQIAPTRPAMVTPQTPTIAPSEATTQTATPPKNAVSVDDTAPKLATKVLGQRVRRWLISEQYEQPERTRVESFNWRPEFVTALSDALIKNAYQAVVKPDEPTDDLTPVQLDAIAAHLTKVAPIRKQLVNNVIENLDEGVALTRVDWQPEVAQVYATLGDGSEIMYVQINLRTGYCHG